MVGYRHWADRTPEVRRFMIADPRRWLAHYPFIHKTVHAILYEPVELYEVKRLVLDLILAPEKYELWFECCFGGVFLETYYRKVARTGRTELKLSIL
jgi:hypothetical protein